MKKENIFLPISIIILGGCLILSAWIVSNGLKYNEQNNIAQVKALMTADEAAQYIGISIIDFDLLIKNQLGEKAGLQSYDTYRFIPFIEIGNQKYFNRAEIDNWIQYNMLNKH